MEEVDRVNEVLYETVGDIEPDRFRSELEAVIADASLTPGVLTVRTAAALAGGPTPEAAGQLAAARQLGAGVQLSYEGLSLTRQLAREDPWTGDGELTDHDLDLIVAETMVSRGFYHLADSGVATDAVEIVRRFGRNISHELGGEEPTERSLEVDVVILAVEAGADLVLDSVPAALAEYAHALAERVDSVPLPDPERGLQGVDEELERIVDTHDLAATEDAT